MSVSLYLGGRLYQNVPCTQGGIHEPILTGSGRQAARHPAFNAINTVIANVKTAITSTFHAGAKKHVPRRLAEFAWHFNRRYDLAAMSAQDIRRPLVMAALARGLRARNRDFVDRPAPNKNSAADTLVTTNRLFATDPEFLRDTLSASALEKLGLLVATQHRRGVAPIDPREWGMFLAHIVGR